MSSNLVTEGLDKTEVDRMSRMSAARVFLDKKYNILLFFPGIAYNYN